MKACCIYVCIGLIINLLLYVFTGKIILMMNLVLQTCCSSRHFKKAAYATN